MKWQGRRQSSNLEDQRGISGKKALFGGGSLLMIGIVLFGLFTGKDISGIMGFFQNQSFTQTSTEQRELTPEEKQTGEFVATILADTEDIWGKIFQENGLTYKQPKLVLFTSAVQTACGGANAAVGPFYCPADQKVYIDMSFFQELKNSYGGKGGDFAIAYVVAHEIGHHVQNLLGTSEKMQQLQNGKSQKVANQLSVALELQADFYSGIWTHYNDQWNQAIEAGDIEEALNTASVVGDDALQKKTQGEIIPDAFTHGTSEQRMYWFNKGYKSGDMNQGDTFKELLNINL